MNWLQKLFSSISLIKIIFFLSFFTSCEKIRQLEQKAGYINNYDKVAMTQSKEIRLLYAQITDLNFKIKELQSQNNFLKIKLKKLPAFAGEKMEIGPEGSMMNDGSKKSIIAQELGEEKDLVKFNIYNWKPEQLYVIAQSAYTNKDYEKSAQYFHTLIQEYPKFEKIDDMVLFKAGVSAFEGESHYNWAHLYFNRVIQNFPTGPYYLSSKLWLGLTYHKEKNYDSFYKVVEEFRLKYRNTQEWKIISAHYEEFTQKYKK